MTLFIGILLAVFVFFVVVFLHELGHFFVARICGVRVHEFGLGIPPKLVRLFRDKRGTEWTLNWLPLGGFVRLKGEDTFSPESRDDDALPSASWWRQVMILLAGVFMNFLLAALIFGALFYRGTPPLTIHVRELAPEALLSRVGEGTQLIAIVDTVEEAEKRGLVERFPGVILDPLPLSVAEKGGIRRGDILVALGGQSVEKPEDVLAFMKDKTTSLEFTLLRPEGTVNLSLMPKEGKIGAYIAPHMKPVFYEYSFFRSLLYGTREVIGQIRFSLNTLGTIIRTSFSPLASREEKQEATAGIGGPVAIGRVFVSLADEGVALRAVLILTAMISLSLGVFNLLPFPALDGGRVFVILVNQIIHLYDPRFKISPRIEQMIHSIGFAILIFGSILIAYKDIFIR